MGDRSDFGGRLKWAFDQDGRTREEIAEAMGTAGPRLSEWTSGTKAVSLEYLLRILENVDVDGHWLLTGEGHPTPTNGDDAVRRLELVRRFADPNLRLSEEAYDRLLDEAERLVEAASNRGGS